MSKSNLDVSGTENKRKSRGRNREEASFPVPLGETEMPDEYAAVLDELKNRIQSERLRVTLAANSAMVLMYWDIGKVILGRQERQGWGAKVIDRLSYDLKNAFPDMSGFSPRNLKYMRTFAEAWPEREIVQRTVAQIPWRSNLALLDKLEDHQTRLWYAYNTIENGWSRDILAMQIESNLHKRQGQAINNFDISLPPADSDMAAHVFKDPYLFDFLGTADPRKEREVEQGLMDHIQRFLLELGAGFAFVGRQVLLEVGDSDFYLDLLFYHLKLRCYVVVELKAVPFDPGFVGQLNLYLSAVDDLMRHPDDRPTIGLLLCKSKDQLVAEYALRRFNSPMGVAQWETRLTETLPDDLKGSLPTIGEIEAELMLNEKDAT
ncbi:MAG: PDDEXK nuclease domain-containing protein [Deltaproteobacteria bacterium]|jgi:predicted nuclease of restriction endonuclease-like (RecB) superfamily|nr:PDDEXK nuclease domain-containing protein [Deltaproteobacteria bacterium]